MIAASTTRATTKPSSRRIPWTGSILAVPQQNLVEINIGADDGLRKGHKLEVVRMNGGTTYVGRIEVTADHARSGRLPRHARHAQKPDAAR